MGGDAGRGLKCQKIMDGKENSGKTVEKVIPTCCLKARSVDPDLEANCHSTVVSDWFSGPGEIHSLEMEKNYTGQSQVPRYSCFPVVNIWQVLVLDGILQLTEKDECAYQEMICHLPLFSIQSPVTVIPSDPSLLIK